jgi:hypothetical protein
LALPILSAEDIGAMHKDHSEELEWQRQYQFQWDLTAQHGA